MYITAETVEALEAEFGKPTQARLVFEMRAEEFERLKASMKDSRAHDVTLFIFRDQQVAVIRKPMYPHGVFRTPSGGVRPGEDFRAGALREAYEETGLEAALRDYLLRVHVTFMCMGEEVEWTSHVFTAEAIAGEIQPIDRDEIAEAFWVTVDELRASSAALRATGSTGLQYRATLNDMMMELLSSRAAPTSHRA